MFTYAKHSIAPERVIRGEHAWEESLLFIPKICRSPLLIGRSQRTKQIRSKLFKDLQSLELNSASVEIKNDCCEEDLQQLEIIAREAGCDGVIAAGGGKVLDSGKLLANRLKIPCITVPLSAATCAGWTALSNIYSSKGKFQRDELLDRCPELMIFDHSFVRTAPVRTLASGIADALAKWYESSVSSRESTDGLVQQAVQLARVLRDQLLIDSIEALQDSTSDAWIRVAEGCAITAGLIGGIGGAQCRTVAAHAIHNGLTQLEACHGSLHGEKVGYGILVQLRLEEIVGQDQLSGQARRQLISFLNELGLPTTLNDLGLSQATLKEIQQVCEYACLRTSDIKRLPFVVNPCTMLEAFFSANEDCKRIEYKATNKLKST